MSQTGTCIHICIQERGEMESRTIKAIPMTQKTILLFSMHLPYRTFSMQPTSLGLRAIGFFLRRLAFSKAKQTR